jgi:hypothetical protein
MLCQQCEREVLLGRRERPDATTEKLAGLVCGRCGKVLPVDDGTRRLLDKLTQLSRFGLGGESPPLLEPSPLRGES